MLLKQAVQHQCFLNKVCNINVHNIVQCATMQPTAAICTKVLLNALLLPLCVHITVHVCMRFRSKVMLAPLHAFCSNAFTPPPHCYGVRIKTLMLLSFQNMFTGEITIIHHNLRHSCNPHASCIHCYNATEHC